MRTLRVLAPNPGLMTLDGTNTWIVGEGPSLVIDPGPAIAPHIAEVAREARGVAAILLTHDHGDHAEGAEALAARTGASVHSVRPGAGGERLRDGQMFEARGVRLVVVTTPGHSPDHVAFHDVATGALFTGDAVLGRGTSVIDPPEGELVAYMRSLRRMRDLAPTTLFPGHGPVVLRAIAKLDSYIAHRQEREEQVLASLLHGPRTPEAIAREVYADLVPEAIGLAARTMLAHLLKLQSEGRVDRDGTDGPFRARIQTPCERCGRPVRGRGRLCAACAVSSLQEPG